MPKSFTDAVQTVERYVNNIVGVFARHADELDCEFSLAMTIDIWWSYFLHAIRQNNFQNKHIKRICNVFEIFLTKSYVELDERDPNDDTVALFTLITCWYLLTNGTIGPTTPGYVMPTNFTFGEENELMRIFGGKPPKDECALFVRVMKKGYDEYTEEFKDDSANAATWADFYLSSMLHLLYKLPFTRRMRELVANSLVEDFKEALENKVDTAPTSIKFTFTILEFCVMAENLLYIKKMMNHYMSDIPPTKH